MKKIALLLAAICLVFAACDETKPTDETKTTAEAVAETENEISQDIFSINTIKVVDSMQYPAEVVEEYGDLIDTDMAHFYAEMDLPVTSNTALKDAIVAYLLDKANGSSSNPDAETNFEFGDGLSMLQAMKDYFFANEGPSGESTTYDKMTDSTDKYITYKHERSYYPAGAAHPGYSIEGVTFKKETGKPFSWEMFTDLAQALELVKYAILEQYFEVNLDEFNVNDLYNYFDLAGYNDEMLELPLTQPWIENGKMFAIYQEYEVCNYSFGTPNCILPYDAIKDILTEEGKAYFE